MAEATVRFFEDLDRQGYEPLLAKLSGTLRFDLHEGPQTMHWLVRIDRGQIRVAREDMEADAVVGTSPGLFEDLVTGRENGLAALLRGDMTITGDARLIVQLDRIFPGPPHSVGPHRYRKGVR
ncbi:SCP2 sterol-binding domain-containing protein [Micromonospora fiedleri]|uniref:SCP2 sterol-binding domain-containing protein n=1 Tax=Micromonospora fiedleri TaxID=1157498 RepID=A0ABS1UMA6_9ACTN|nr:MULTISPECIES: SCP2 sterol-binding domain-containing protein [Micromonospora]MBL6277379.1 SCP2 sterol-binding domain-containing protein [Micromonospora fiedleri]WSK42236.1 SCP2 sterol-binding domain-containing protein [Micromonospora maris]